MQQWLFKEIWKFMDETVEDDVAVTYSKLFSSKVKTTGKTPLDGNMKNVEIAVLLKHQWYFFKNSCNNLN